MEESLGYGCLKGEVPLYPCGEGLGRGYETCEAMTDDIVLPNVSTLMHVFSATDMILTALLII